MPAAGAEGRQKARCTPRPAERFALASGESRQIPTLSAFRMCVSTEADAEIPGCTAPEAIAAP
jgi:hypothetical protein